ncbi:MAG: hypothetical protein JJT94_14250 [Bernardetiaceae bacterium]|nr:hypothetical protein [Bernardetiaceae bacterium]
MKYINPFQLLDIDLSKLQNSNNIGSQIRMAKQRKLSEIEFSDNAYILFQSQEITKNDVNKYADFLTDVDKYEYYLFITNYKDLDNFLQQADTNIFNNFRQEAMYRDKKFVDFISPFFSDSYAIAYLQALKSRNKTLLQKMELQTSLILKEDFDSALQKTKLYIEGLTEKYQEVGLAIDEGEFTYSGDDISRSIKTLLTGVDVECFNFVNKYLQPQRNHLAQTIRNLSVSIYNAYADDTLALYVVKLAKAIYTDGLASKNISDAYEQIYEIHTNREQERKYEPDLNKFGIVLSKVIQLIESVSKHKVSLNINTIISDTDVRNLNTLPDDIFIQIRNQIALALVGLSVAVWENYQDIEQTYELSFTAQKLNVDVDTKKIIRNSFEQVEALKRQRNLLQKYQLKIETLKNKVREVERGIITGEVAYSNANRLIPVQQINLEGLEANDIKEVFCQLINNLAVAVFNKLHDFDNAINILQIGRSINGTSEGKRKVESTYKQLNQMKLQEQESIRRQFAEIIGVFANIYSQIKDMPTKSINHDHVVNIFRNVFSREVIDFVAEANAYSDLQNQLFQNCKNIANKLKKDYALDAIRSFEEIGKNNNTLASSIRQFKAEQTNRSSGLWNSIFGN